jgi:6-phosphogluconolactonase
MTKPEINHVPSAAQAGTELFADTVVRCVDAQGQCSVVLSGGTTPLAMFDRLREQDLPWEHLLFFWGDDRFVPHDHPDSNYRAAREALLDHVPVRKSNIFPWPYLEGDPAGAAADYASTITQTLGTSFLFDLTYLGLGSDAHTASLFPHTGVVHEPGITVVCEPATAPHTRLSLTSHALGQSRIVAFLVSGENKREALQNTLNGPRDPDRYPAQAISAQERLVWLTDIEP